MANEWPVSAHDPNESAMDYYICDVECHIMPEDYRRHIKYFPKVSTFEYAHKMCMHWVWTDHVKGIKYTHPGMDWTAEKIIADYDSSGVDQSCLMRESFIDTTMDSAPFSTNNHVIEAMEKYPDRFIGCSNVGPFSKRKIKDVLWELEYLHKNFNFKTTKFYLPEDTYINDRRLWPVYEKCEEMGIVALFHVGLTIRIGYTKYVFPHLLDDVLTDFPNLKAVAYHGGYPYWEELVMLCWKHPNLHISYSILLPWLLRAPERFQHMVGLTMQIVGSDRFVWGSDWPASDPGQSIQAVLNLRMPEELQERYGYPEITKEDRWKFLGGNLARLMGIDPKKNMLKVKREHLRKVAARRRPALPRKVAARGRR